jgi:hypothetical protein
MTFILKIEMGNDAMQTTEDISEALDQVKSELESNIKRSKIFDRNGNTVGKYFFNEEQI